MRNTADKLIPFAVNGVILLSKVKQTNYPLFKFVAKHIDKINKTLEDEGLAVLNDTKAIKTEESIKLFLQYTYGDTVDITDLFTNHWMIYSNIMKIETPSKLIQKMGFNIKNKIEEEITKKLQEVETNSKKITLGTISKKYYNKIYYQAKKKNMNYKEYIRYLGFKKK